MDSRYNSCIIFLLHNKVIFLTLNTFRPLFPGVCRSNTHQQEHSELKSHCDHHHHPASRVLVHYCSNKTSSNHCQHVPQPSISGPSLLMGEAHKEMSVADKVNIRGRHGRSGDLLHRGLTCSSHLRSRHHRKQHDNCPVMFVPQSGSYRT